MQQYAEEEREFPQRQRTLEEDRRVRAQWLDHLTADQEGAGSNLPCTGCWHGNKQLFNQYSISEPCERGGYIPDMNRNPLKQTPAQRYLL